MLGVVLGSGFSDLVDYFDVVDTISYEEIIGFKVNHLEGHKRKLILCRYDNQDLVILSGKLHYYEGYSEYECTLPIRYAINKFGLKKIIVTSASGALSSNIKIGNWYKLNAILSFPTIKISCGNQNSEVNSIKKGYSYNYHQGPSLGTESEYKMLDKLGFNFVGMSMLHEAKLLNRTNLEASFLTFPVCNYGLKYEEPSFEDVVSLASSGVIDLSEKIKAEFV